jgi:beta-lactamase class A
VASAERWGDVPKRVSLARLLELSIGVSDNTAHDVLLGLAGGPRAANRQLRALGLEGVTVLDLYQRGPRAGKRLTTVGVATPEAIVGLLRALHDGKLLAPPTRDHLMRVMFESPVGADRLKGGVPSGTAVAHKTGTGQTATNDVGLIPLPDGRGHLLIAAFVSGVPHGPAASATIAALARAAYDHFAAAGPAPPR